MAIQVIKAKDLVKNKTLNTIVYGAPGAGKTTFCATAPKPLIIDVENGTISISDRDIDIVQANSIEDIREAIKYAQEQKYETVCIDSLTRYSEIAMEDILRNDGKKKAQIQHWGELVNHVKKMIWHMQAQGINTIFVCLEKEIEEDGQLIKRPNLNGQLVQAIPGIVDAVGYLKINQNGERELCLNPSERYYAKHRAPQGNRITENIEPDFMLLRSLIYGGQEQCAPNLQAA